MEGFADEVRGKDASIGYKKQVLSSNINMASEPGMVTAILGQNGCGKTTFVKSLMKLIPWCGGGAFLDGVDMRNIKDRQLWRKMAYVPQKFLRSCSSPSG